MSLYGFGRGRERWGKIEKREFGTIKTKGCDIWAVREDMIGIQLKVNKERFSSFLIILQSRINP